MPRTLVVNVAGDGDGTVEALPMISCPPDCVGEYLPGTQVFLTALPTGTASAFAEWSGDCTGTSPGCTVLLTEDAQVTATFEQVTRRVTINTAGAGRGRVGISLWDGPVGSSISCLDSCFADYSYGHNLRVWHQASFGSRFGQWTSCPGTGTTGDCYVEVTSNLNATAAFHLGQTWSGIGTDRIRDIAIAPDDSLYLVGIFDDELDFGGVTVDGSTYTPPHGFIAKLSGSSYAGIWAKRVSDNVSVVRTDPAGNAIIATTYNSASLGFQWLLARFRSSDGTVDRSGGGYGEVYVRDMATDDTDNVAVVGRFRGTASYEGQTIVGTGSSLDLFVGLLDVTTWEFSWLRSYGGANQESPQAVVFDDTGDIWVVGSIYDSGTVGGDVFVSPAGGYIGFVAHYDGITGDHVESWSFPASGSSSVQAVSVATGGELTVAGSMYGVGNFGGADLGSAGMSAAFRVQYDATGAHVSSWATPFSSGFAPTYGVVLTDTGNVVRAGSFTGSYDLPTTTLTSAGSTDVFFVKLDGASGTVLSARRAGGPNADEARGLVVDSVGRSYIAGWFWGDGDFGPGTGDSDLFLWPIAP